MFPYIWKPGPRALRETTPAYPQTSGQKRLLSWIDKLVTELGPKSGPKWCRNRNQKAYQINVKTGINKYNEHLQKLSTLFFL